MVEKIFIDRKAQSEENPDNTDDYCNLLYKCKCGHNVYDTDNYCSKCGRKLFFIYSPTLNPKFHNIPK